jgi:hypothetical protein
VKGEAIGNQGKKNSHAKERAHHEASDEMQNETKGTKTLNPILNLRRTETLKVLRTLASPWSQMFLWNQ